MLSLLPLFALLLIHGVFTVRSRCIQKHIFKAVRLSLSPEASEGSGSISPFAALSTILAATLGTGNIIGVSTAIAMGGPGALFWCWLTGIFGMATSYAESYLGIRFRVRTESGSWHGGPMYLLKNQLGLIPLSKCYSFLLLCSSLLLGCGIQSNSVTASIHFLAPVPTAVIASVLTVLLACILFGGLKRISQICEKLIPVLAIFFFVSCLFILLRQVSYIPEAVKLILKDAFSFSSVSAGVLGGLISPAFRFGVARGLFTNEAGLGTVSITSATARTDCPERQSLITMTATFWDTVVLCLITGLAIITTMLHYPESFQGVLQSDYTSVAFGQLPLLGASALTLCLIGFAVATMIGWSYLGEEAAFFLFGPKASLPYRIFYLIFCFAGAYLSVASVWGATDILNIALMVPGLMTLILLRKEVKYPGRGQF